MKRRSFLRRAGRAAAGAGLVVAGGSPARSATAKKEAGMTMTIQDVIDAILKEIPGGPVANTVDTFKSGDPKARVTGVVTTFIATRRVLDRAKALGANLVITHEPTFYNHRDEPTGLEGDPVYESKRRFLQEAGIAVWRFHDYWHRHRPDGIITGLARKLGWQECQSADHPGWFRIPETTLRDLAAMLKKTLDVRVLRAAGEPDMKVVGVATSVGCGPWAGHLKALQSDEVDVLVCGESAEWQACEYVRDSRPAGRRKGLIVLGHCNSEEAGMEYLADWLKAKVPGVPVTFVAAGDPFWSL